MARADHEIVRTKIIGAYASEARAGRLPNWQTLQQLTGAKSPKTIYDHLATDLPRLMLGAANHKTVNDGLRVYLLLIDPAGKTAAQAKADQIDATNMLAAIGGYINQQCGVGHSAVDPRLPGIYYIHDHKHNMGYVGLATGSILGRVGQEFGNANCGGLDSRGNNQQAIEQAMIDHGVDNFGFMALENPPADQLARWQYLDTGSRKRLLGLLERA